MNLGICVAQGFVAGGCYSRRFLESKFGCAYHDTTPFMSGSEFAFFLDDTDVDTVLPEYVGSGQACYACSDLEYASILMPPGD